MIQKTYLSRRKPHGGGGGGAVGTSSDKFTPSNTKLINNKSYMLAASRPNRIKYPFSKFIHQLHKFRIV